MSSVPGPRRRAPSARPTFAGQIRATIDARRLSASALARAAGLDRRLIARFQSGLKDITLTTADRLCAELGLRLTDAAPRRPPRPSPFTAAATAPPAPPAGDAGDDDGGPDDAA